MFGAFAKTHELQMPEYLADDVSALLNALGKRYVAYYPSLADVTGSPKAALMLGHAIYMTRTVMDKQPGRGGWFWKTSTEWQQVTGLSVREQETARKMLVTTGILQETRRGMPSKLWFKVDLDRLATLLCQYANTKYRPWSWEDRVIKALLGKPVMFYAPFAWAAGSAVSGLYMSHLFNKLRQSIAGQQVDAEGWFSTPISHSLNQLRFGRKALMNARAKLSEAGMMEEARESCMKSQMLSRVMLTNLTSKIALEATKFHSLSEYDNQECRNTTIKSFPKRESRVSESANQEFPNPQNKSSPFREASSADTATRTYKEINTTYQHPHNWLGVVDKSQTQKGETQDFSELICPDKLLPGERSNAIKLLREAHSTLSNAQVILDELAGQMQDGHVKSPLGYLRTLIKLDQSGRLIPEHAQRVATARERRQQALQERMKQAEAREIEQPVNREVARQTLEDLRQRMGLEKRT